ncbi:MAG: BglG family transcription antiterminator LicT [Anaerorhabdus sp.]
MKIHKILNNNVVVIKDNDKEFIVTGKGIGYRAKCNDEVNEALIEKQYFAQEIVDSKFHEWFKEIPSEYIEIGDEILSYAKLKLPRKINDNIFIGLVDHIYNAVKRHQDGIDLPNKMLWEVKRFYPDEFNIAKKAISIIKDKVNEELIEDECVFIALHLVNAQSDGSVNDLYDATKLIKEITNIVKYYFHIEFDEETIQYYRFITHLKFFSNRIISKKQNDDNKDDDLLAVVKNKYRNSYLCVLKIKEFIEAKYDYDLAEEEILYLIIHIERVVYKK